MKILLLTQKLPLPLEDGYNLRIQQYVRRMGDPDSEDRHEIHMVSLDEGTMPEELRPCLASLTILPVRAAGPSGNPLARLLQAFSADHFFDFDPAIMDRLRKIVAEGAFDMIWVSGWRLLPYTRQLQGIPILGDVVDEGAQEAWIDFKKARGMRAKLMSLKHWWNCRSFEKRYFAHLDICALVAERDAEAVQALCPGLRVATVHNGVDTDFFAPDEGRAIEPCSLVFEGGMTHVPNVDGIVHFHRNILPLIKERLPDARLWIVGRDPAPAVKALAGPDVEVTGFVADVRPYLARSAVFISPLIGGAGIKNKVLQAWAMGLPVVATPVSSGGLKARDGENMLIADGAEAFAAACTRLLLDAQLRTDLGAAGRQTAIEHYSWDSKTKELEALCLELGGKCEPKESHV